MTKKEWEGDVKLIQGACDTLSEHFDTVQIFVTRHEDGETVHYEGGLGNWYARVGQVKGWVTQKDALEEDSAFDGAFDDEGEGEETQEV